MSDQDGWSELHLAALSGESDRVALLVAEGLDANQSGPGGVHVA